MFVFRKFLRPLDPHQRDVTSGSGHGVTFQNNYMFIITAVKVKVSRNRPRWPKEFRLG